MERKNEIITRLLEENKIDYHVIGDIIIITCQQKPNGTYDCINWTGSGIDQLIKWLNAGK